MWIIGGVVILKWCKTYSICTYAIHLFYYPLYGFFHCVTLMLLLLLRVVNVENMYLSICSTLRLPQNRGNHIRCENININYYLNIILENMGTIIG